MIGKSTLNGSSSDELTRYHKIGHMPEAIEGVLCSECGSNYVQYGRTDYVCSGHYNGATCTNGARFRIADAERTILDAIRYDFTSPAAVERAAESAMAYYEREHARSAQTVTVRDEALSAIDAREADVREQYKLGKLPSAVFTAWLGELDRERSALGCRSAPKHLRVTRDDVVRAYREIVAKRLEVLTTRENAATAREGCDDCLSRGESSLSRTLNDSGSKASRHSMPLNFSPRIR